MFLTKDDLYTAILQEELEEITRSTDTLMDECMDIAEEEMRLILHDSFDTQVIFAKTEQDRHKLLVRIGVDIAIYNIVARCMAGQDLEDRRARYNNGIKWLKELRDSTTYPNLERKNPTAQVHIHWGSNSKRKNYY